MGNKNNIGIIAENISDVNTVKNLISSISEKKISEKHHLGYGSGKIISKCREWADSLYNRKCGILIVIHDSDENKPSEIHEKISRGLKKCPFSNYLVSIPVKELEAWLLSDPVGIKKAMNLKTLPKINGNPQDINSPKEYLGKIIDKHSNRTKKYLNTKHNEIIAIQTSIKEIHKKCESFRPFYEFIINNIN
jgi:hypothetical protein